MLIKKVTELQSVGKELERRSASIEAFCQSFIITDDLSYGEADQRVSETRALEKGVEDYWSEIKSPAYKAWKNICDKEKAMLRPINAGAKILTTKMAEYREKREAIQKAEREKKEEENTLAMKVKALELAEEGYDPKAVEAVMEMAEEPSVAKPQELRGRTSFQVDYEVEIVKGEESKIPDYVWKPTTKAMQEALIAKVKKLAKVTGGEHIDGFKITQINKARRKSL